MIHIQNGHSNILWFHFCCARILQTILTHTTWCSTAASTTAILIIIILITAVFSLLFLFVFLFFTRFTLFITFLVILLGAFCCSSWAPPCGWGFGGRFSLLTACGGGCLLRIAVIVTGIWNQHVTSMPDDERPQRHMAESCVLEVKTNKNRDDLCVLINQISYFGVIILIFRIFGTKVGAGFSHHPIYILQ